MVDSAQPLVFPFLMSYTIKMWRFFNIMIKDFKCTSHLPLVRRDKRTMCLMAISRELFENDLPSPLLFSITAVEVFRVLREVTSETFEILRGSGASVRCCPLPP